jgi:hypothetical protein
MNAGRLSESSVALFFVFEGNAVHVLKSLADLIANFRTPIERTQSGISS